VSYAKVVLQHIPILKYTDAYMKKFSNVIFVENVLRKRECLLYINEHTLGKNLISVAFVANASHRRVISIYIHVYILVRSRLIVMFVVSLSGRKVMLLFTGELIQERNHSSVGFARNVFRLVENSRSMCVLILVRSLLNVKCVESLLHGPEIWQFIGEFTLDKSLTNVMSVIGDLYEAVTSESISGHTLQRKQACSVPQFVTNHNKIQSNI
jgi:hypothetical protein